MGTTVPRYSPPGRDALSAPQDGAEDDAFFRQLFLYRWWRRKRCQRWLYRLQLASRFCSERGMPSFSKVSSSSGSTSSRTAQLLLFLLGSRVVDDVLVVDGRVLTFGQAVSPPSVNHLPVGLEAKKKQPQLGNSGLVFSWPKFKAKSGPPILDHGKDVPGFNHPA